MGRTAIREAIAKEIARNLDEQTERLSRVRDPIARRGAAVVLQALRRARRDASSRSRSS